MASEREAAEDAALIANAREAIASRLEGRAPAWPEGGPALEGCGAFVTLRKGGVLRGCIGRMRAEGRLVDTIRAMARAAAFEDPRFPALMAEELGRVSIEVTVLSEPRPAEGPRSIEIGKQGVLMTLRGRSAVFLPQVATEQGWGLEELLENLCYKAGLPGDAWRDPAASFQVFEGRIIEERPVS